MLLDACVAVCVCVFLVEFTSSSMIIALIACDSVKTMFYFVYMRVQRHSSASQLFSLSPSFVRIHTHTHTYTCRKLIGGPTATITISDALNF